LLRVSRPRIGKRALKHINILFEKLSIEHQAAHQRKLTAHVA